VLGVGGDCCGVEVSSLNILAGLLSAAPAVGLVQLWRAERKSGPKLVDPPTLGCGCADRGGSLACPDCDQTRCYFHRDHKLVCPGRPDRDGDLIAVDTPAIVAGPQLTAEWIAEQFAAIAAGAADLNTLDSLAEFYLLPEVTQ